MEQKKIFAIVAVVIVALAAFAVGFAIPKGDSSSDNKVTVRVAYGNLNGWDAVIYANETGMFENEGVHVESVMKADGGESMAAVMNNSADITFVGVDPIINSAVAESAVGLRVVGTMMMPLKSIMYMDYNKTKITPDNVVVTAGEDTTTKNIINGIVSADGTPTGQKIGIALKTAWKSYFGGYVELLFKGGTVNGVTYAADQITEKQYNAMMNFNDDRIYTAANVPDLATAILSGNVAVIVGPYEKLGIAAQQDDKIECFNSTGSIAAGFCLAVATKKIVEEHPEAIASVLRAIDKAGCIMRDDSTQHSFAKKTAWSIYNTKATESNIEEYAALQEKYYSSVILDVCNVAETSKYISATAKILGYSDFDVADVYDAELEAKILKMVHDGGKYHRSFDAGISKFVD